MEFTKEEENSFRNIDLLKDEDTAKLREKRAIREKEVS